MNKEENCAMKENGILEKYPYCVPWNNGAILAKSIEEYDKMFDEIQFELARAAFDQVYEDICNGCFEEDGNLNYNKIYELKEKYMKKDCISCKYFVGCSWALMGKARAVYKEEK